MKPRLLAALMGATVVVACGDGGGAGTSTTPTSTPSSATSPTPSPSPASSPTPTPASYTTFANLSGDQNYTSTCVSYAPRDTNRTPTLAGTQSSFGTGSLSFTSATQTYKVIAPSGATETFEPSTRVAGTTSGTLFFTKTGPSGNPETFSIIQPAAGGTALDYTRIANEDIEGSASSGNRFRQTGFCILGVPTLTTDIPPTPLVSFTKFNVAGEAYDTRGGTFAHYTLNKSVATLSVDLLAGSVTSTLHAIGTTASGVDVDLGTYTGTGGINASTAGFNMSMVISATSTNQGIVRANGGFFGPQGKEFGYTFSLFQDSIGTPTDVELVLIGQVTGAR